MSGDDIPKRNLRKWVILTFLLIAFAIAAYIVVSLITGTGLIQLQSLFSSRVPAITVDEFNFDVGRNRSFAHMDSSIASVGTLGVQVLNAEGRETLRDSFRMSQPAIISSGGKGVAFDIGGTTLRTFSQTQVTTTIDTDGAIVSASINRNGWFCVVTQEGGGLRGTVTVYNSMGLDVYRVNVGSGYVLFAQLSDNNRNLVILSLTDNGSRITFFHGIDAEEEPDHMVDFPDELIVDIKYLANGDVLALSMNSLLLVKSTGVSTELYSFNDKRLGGYAFDGEFAVLHLYDFGIGFTGRLVTIDSDGVILSELTTDWELLSISAIENSLVILKGDGISFYNEELVAFPVSADSLSAVGANRVLAVGDGVAIATSDNSAVVLLREDPIEE